MTTPHERLAWGLAGLLAEGDLPPCCGSGAWVSEDRDERSLAALACMPCPLLEVCGEAADSTKERFGVWAGVDRTQPAGKRKGAA